MVAPATAINDVLGKYDRTSPIMIEQSQQPVIGSVLRASTMGFVCGTRSQDISHPSFGAFVRTYHSPNEDMEVIGLIHAISIDDDPLVRQMILANQYCLDAR